jgi:S-adenosylmethionine hydrolase
MKGVILERFPGARIVDLAHDIPAQWPPEAGFWVRRAYEYFPCGTVHLAIVDPGVGTERDILIVEHDRHIFMAPDNGLLAQLLDNAENSRVYKLDLSRLGKFGILSPSATFHGRDIFAPLAAELASGRTAPMHIGKLTHDWTPGWLDEPTVAANKVSGTIVTIDSFGNLISNIDAEQIAPIKQPLARIGGHELPLLQTYGRAAPGDYLALINSFGVIEVARAEGNAADSLGLERGAPISISATA